MRLWVFRYGGLRAAAVCYTFHILYVYGTDMGIVKISEQMHDNLRTASEALSRSINSQAEHWLRIGMLAEIHPDLRYSEICQLLLRSSREGQALDLRQQQAAEAGR